MSHFLLARLGSGAQLQVIETVTPHLKMRLETAETERENVRLGLAAMPAAASENTPQEVFGRNMANRRCSEWREVSTAGLTAVGKDGRKAELRQSGPEDRNDKASKRSRNRQVMEKAKPACRGDWNHRLTGPDTGKVTGRRKPVPNGTTGQAKAGSANPARRMQRQQKQTRDRRSPKIVRKRSRCAWG